MTLNDKIKGALYGMALGDALGLGTEFMTVAEAKTHYPDGLRDFQSIIRDVHRSQWKPGEWTNDTEMTFIVLNSLMERGKIDILDIAPRMKNWFEGTESDPVAIYRLVFREPDWTANPKEVADRVWRERGLNEASNEAINRALISGLMSHNADELTDMTRELVLMTHYDSRCVCSAAVMAMMIHDLFWHDRQTPFEELVELASTIDKRTIPYIEHAYDCESIADLKLDDRNTFWYTRKAMASALWALWHCDTPGDMLGNIVDAAGDADTNASIAMIVGGLKYGYDALPDLVNRLAHRDRIDDMVARFSAFMAREAETRNL